MSYQHYIVRIPFHGDYKFYTHPFLKGLYEGKFEYNLASIYTRAEADDIIANLPEGQGEIAEIVLVGLS